MSGSDLIHVPCRHSVKDAVVRLETQLKARDIPLFAEFDHKANAVGAGLAMPEATVLVFGNPAVGTKLMLEASTLALDLPLRILAREEGDKRLLTYRDSRASGRERGLDEGKRNCGQVERTVAVAGRERVFLRVFCF